MTDQTEQLAKEFFQKEDLVTVDFEIALAALLATILLAYPLSDAVGVGKFLAISLLLLTVLRRMAIAGPFASTERILTRTMFPMNVLAACAVIYLIALTTRQAATSWPLGSEIQLFSLFTIGFLMGSVLLHEFMFRDYLAWWCVKFRQKELEETLFENIWREAALMAYWGAMARRDASSWRKFGKLIPGGRPDTELNFDRSELLRYFLGVGLIFTFLYSIPVLIGMYLIGIVGIFLVFAVAWIHDHAAFWYIAYGNPTYDDLTHHFTIVWGRTIFYVVFSYSLIFGWSELHAAIPYF